MWIKIFFLLMDRSSFYNGYLWIDLNMVSYLSILMWMAEYKNRMWALNAKYGAIQGEEEGEMWVMRDEGRHGMENKSYEWAFGWGAVSSL